MSLQCHGNGATHCCYVNGAVCPFLEEDTVPGRKWVCGLLRELGDWNLVHTDERYLSTVRPVWDAVGMADCGDWRGTGRAQCCFDDNEPVYNQ